ncbi:MAG: tautomerase family protein [Thermoproteota archaeon]
MPVVHVYVWTGFSNEAKRRVVSGITRVFAETGVPPEAVEIIIQRFLRKTGESAGSGRVRGSAM